MISDKDLQIIMNYILREKSKCVQDRTIIDAIQKKGMSRLQAAHPVENSGSNNAKDNYQLWCSAVLPISFYCSYAHCFGYFCHIQMSLLLMN